LSATLRTAFDQGSRTDTYSVFQSYRTPRGAMWTHFLTTQGFIVDAGAVTVYAANTRAELSSAADRVDLRDVSGSDLVQVDSERGLVRVYDYDLSGMFVEVGYSAGFSESGGVYDGVPAWLEQAAITRALVSVVQNPTLYSKDDNPPDVDALWRSLARQLEGKPRYEPLARKPL